MFRKSSSPKKKNIFGWRRNRRGTKGVHIRVAGHNKSSFDIPLEPCISTDLSEDTSRDEIHDSMENQRMKTNKPSNAALEWKKIPDIKLLVQALQDKGMYEEIGDIDDPIAKASGTVKRSKLSVESTGDGDVWYEAIRKNVKSGKVTHFFISIRTGEKSIDEPPTGASKVVYLKKSIRESDPDPCTD